MSKLLCMSFFPYAMLILLFGSHTAHCYQLSFKEGATASYILSNKEEEIINLFGTTSCSQSTTTVAFDIEILSSECNTDGFSNRSSLFHVKTIVKSILLSQTDYDDQEPTTIQYSSSPSALGNDPVEQGLNAIIGIPLHFRIENGNVKETTTHLGIFEHLCDLSTKWEDCEFKNLLEGFLENLFDLAEEPLLVGSTYPLPFHSDFIETPSLKTTTIDTASKVYTIHQIEPEKITASLKVISHSEMDVLKTANRSTKYIG